MTDLLPTRMMSWTPGQRLVTFLLGFAVLVIGALVWISYTPSCPPGGDTTMADCSAGAHVAVRSMLGVFTAWAGLLVMGLLASTILALATGATATNLLPYYGWSIIIHAGTAIAMFVMTVAPTGEADIFVINLYAPALAGMYVFYCTARLLALRAEPSGEGGI